MSFGCVQSIPKCTVSTICRPHPAPGQPFWADAATSSCPEWAARPGGAAQWQNRIDLGDSGWNHLSNNGSWILLILIQATGQLQRESFSVKFDPWEVAKVLIHFKVDVKKTDIYGQTSIFCAARDGNAELRLGTMWSGLVRFEHLPKSQSLSSFWTLQSWDVLVFQNFGENTLKLEFSTHNFPLLQNKWYHVVPLSGLTLRCEFLLQHGCAVNHADTNRQTPIFYSVRNGHVSWSRIIGTMGGPQLHSVAKFCWATGNSAWDHAHP